MSAAEETAGRARRLSGHVAAAFMRELGARVGTHEGQNGFTYGVLLGTERQRLQQLHDVLANSKPGKAEACCSRWRSLRTDRLLRLSSWPGAPVTSPTGTTGRIDIAYRSRSSSRMARTPRHRPTTTSPNASSTSMSPRRCRPASWSTRTPSSIHRLCPMPVTA